MSRLREILRFRVHIAQKDDRKQPCREPSVASFCIHAVHEFKLQCCGICICRRHDIGIILGNACFRLADITHATTWGRVHTFFVAATLINKFYISWVPLFFVDNCEKDMDTLGFEPRAFRMRSGCDTTTPCALCSSLLDSINLLFDWPRTRKQEYSSSSCHNRLANIQCCCGIHLLHDLWLSPSSRFSFISSPLCVGRKRVEHL